MPRRSCSRARASSPPAARHSCVYARPRLFPALLLGLLLCCGPFSVAAFGSDMRGPAPTSPPDKPPSAIESSPVKLGMRGMIRLYQIAVSPINPDRCGFWPSCSAFGVMSIEEYGPLTGVMMTADRLMRCNIWKRPGPDYLLLPDGRLLDPPWRNVLEERHDH